MVLLTRFLGYAAYQAKKPRRYMRKGFLDSIQLYVRGGTGGMGLPRYGGVGGRGGHVYATATEELTLFDVERKYRNKKIIAPHGEESTFKGLLGVMGEDVEIPVPRGVTIFDRNGAVLGDLDKPDSKVIIARGGVGGCEETGWSGQKGEHRVVTLDLKLIADAALVGFPNAGKSTLLRSVSRAKPKIANYPFTTVRPNLGVVQYPDMREIAVADLPGLIEGAHVNVGMGHKFLKHLERCKILVFVVDIQGFRLSVHRTFRNCLETVILLNKELELYKPDLLNMHSILVINKMDTPDAEKKFKEIEPALYDLQSAFDRVSEEIRPEVPLQFNEILTVSLGLEKQEEIEFVKERIRVNLDKQAEEELKKNEELPGEIDVYEKIKKESRRHLPITI
ncbi:GTP-binding protein 10 homolog [Diachasmimorpha longicaudata]|uniref:GTP-binding protein 10 homolog n=1 Tax=Diachasmimorpha longicaudata TaxID=58733 RepID=UPI0030B89041